MIAAIVAFLVGWLLVKPAIKSFSALGAEMVQASSPDARAAVAPRADAARARLIAFGMVGSLFIVIAILAMATARYL
jgi:hypothetical protein